MFWTELVQIKRNVLDRKLEGKTPTIYPFEYVLQERIFFYRAPRTRGSNEDTLPRRVKTPIIISPQLEKGPADHVAAATAPIAQPTTCTYNRQQCQSAGMCTKVANKGLSPEKRLKALSTESLRSVSPGSDSVFYSEADGIIDNQVSAI